MDAYLRLLATCGELDWQYTPIWFILCMILSYYPAYFASMPHNDSLVQELCVIILWACFCTYLAFASELERDYFWGLEDEFVARRARWTKPHLRPFKQQYLANPCLLWRCIERYPGLHLSSARFRKHWRLALIKQRTLTAKLVSRRLFPVLSQICMAYL